MPALREMMHSLRAGDVAPGGPCLGACPPGRPDHEANTLPIEGAPSLAITADELTFRPDRIEMSGEQPAVNVALTSVDTQHDLTVDEISFHLAAGPGQTVVGGLTGRAFGAGGTYVGYCSVPGHREAVMELEIVVSPRRRAGPLTV